MPSLQALQTLSLGQASGIGGRGEEIIQYVYTYIIITMLPISKAIHCGKSLLSLSQLQGHMKMIFLPTKKEWPEIWRGKSETVDGRNPALVDIGEYPVFHRVSYITGGAGFLPQPNYPEYSYFMNQFALKIHSNGLNSSFELFQLFMRSF